MDMTEITIRLPHAGAMRLIEEAMKAGVPPDRFIAMLIEERLKKPSDPRPQSPQPPAEIPPELNADGLKMLRNMLGGPGGPPGGAQPARRNRPIGTKRKPKDRASKSKKRK
jgi:hypothetical protein